MSELSTLSETDKISNLKELGLLIFVTRMVSMTLLTLISDLDELSRVILEIESP